MKTILPALLLCFTFIAHASAGVIMPVFMVSGPAPDCPHHAGQLAEKVVVVASVITPDKTTVGSCSHCNSADAPGLSSACDGCGCAGMASVLQTTDLPLSWVKRPFIAFASPLTTLLSPPPLRLLRPPRS